MPDFSKEDSMEGSICGIDEVGRGPLAGPVVSAAVYIPEEVRKRPFIAELNDSKKIAKGKRENLYNYIIENCCYGLAIIDPDEIDRVNILQATMSAMIHAYNHLTAHISIDGALIDGNKAPQLSCPVLTVVKGDQISNSIAAASILAKVTRDRIMAELAVEYPHYGWESNVGYGAKKHIEAIHKHGYTKHHRKSFEPVKSLSRISATN